MGVVPLAEGSQGGCSPWERFVGGLGGMVERVFTLLATPLAPDVKQ